VGFIKTPWFFFRLRNRKLVPGLEAFSLLYFCRGVSPLRLQLRFFSLAISIPAFLFYKNSAETLVAVFLPYDFSLHFCWPLDRHFIYRTQETHPANKNSNVPAETENIRANKNPFLKKKKVILNLLSPRRRWATRDRDKNRHKENWGHTSS